MAKGRTLRGRAAAAHEAPHQQADDKERSHRQQRHHDEVGQALAHAEVAEQRGQAQTRGEAGDRAHPRALGRRGGSTGRSGRGR
jgi:hypothetical protein